MPRCFIAIQFLYFDLGNVLFHFSHEQMVRQMAELAGVATDVVERVLFVEGLQDRFEAGECDRHDYYEQFCEATSSRPQLAALEEAGSDIFALNSAILPLIERLGQLDLALGVLSNTCENHWRYVSDGRYPVLPGPFQTAVLSYEQRSMKPDRRIYDAAIDRAGLPPEQIFFVDDRPENVEGAKAVGIDAIMFEGVESLATNLRERGFDC